MRPEKQRPPEWSLVIGPSVQSRPWAQLALRLSHAGAEQFDERHSTTSSRVGVEYVIADHLDIPKNQPWVSNAMVTV
jgi:hypothetical protein